MSAQENDNLLGKDNPITDPASSKEIESPADFESQITLLANDGLNESLPTADELEALLSPEIEESQDSNQEEQSATSTVEATKEIPKKDYVSMEISEVLDELKKLVRAEPAQLIKEHVEEIKNVVSSHFDKAEDQAKSTFINEGGNIIDFRYYSEDKKTFNELYYEYRNKRSRYYQSIRKNQQENLKDRQGLIEELKLLKNELGGEDSVNTTFLKFKNLQERWRNAGNIPRDKYNLVWNNYYHHVDQFYEYLHLNRDFRDKHFKQNLDKKLQLIARAEELSKENDVNRAFKELQLLHRIWKDEIGPVSREYSDDIWDKFNAVTKKVHDARREFFKEKEVHYEKNLILKNEVIEKINEIAHTRIESHGKWQQKIKEVEGLRDSFFKIGKVPNPDNEPTWQSFKEATKLFNQQKNNFYKSQKKEYYQNLNKKEELVKIAEENKDSDDYEVVTPLMKKIQADWRKIGHVPRKDSDRIWKQFKDACNHYFDNLHAKRNEASAEEEAAFTKKESLLNQVKQFELNNNPQESLTSIKGIIGQWKGIGKVPRNKKDIEQRFNKELDKVFKQLDISRKESELIRYENRLAAMSDDAAIKKEVYFVQKKIDETNSEINQLENNLGFFQYVDDNNPMVKEVHKNIERQKDALVVWRAKLKKLKTL